MNRFEFNVITGVFKIIELTPDEEAEVIDRAAILAAEPHPKKETVDDIKAALIAKGVLTQADLDAVNRL